MSDHIKTEVDIMKDFKWNYDNKWVSLSWLKEKIEEEISTVKIGNHNYYSGYVASLRLIKKLLEETK